MPVLLDVVPDGYRQAAALLGEDVASFVQQVCGRLLRELDGCYGMAGSDSAGTPWGSAYQDAAEAAIGAAADLVNGCYQLAALLDQTGLNYGGADAASIPGRGALFARSRWTGRHVAALGVVETAVGLGAAEPAGWSMLEHAIGYLWPNGHQDLLRTAAGAWRQAAAQLHTVLPDLDRAIEQVSAQRAPEVGDAVTLIASMRGRVGELAAEFAAVGGACADYAHRLDEAHHRILEELKSFLEWTAGIELAGGLFAVVSFGASEVAAQASELVEIRRAGAAIRAVVETMIGAAESGAAVLDAVAVRVSMLAAGLRPLLARPVVAAEFASVAGPEKVALARKLALEFDTPPTAAAVAPITSRETAALGRIERRADIGHAKIHQFPGIKGRKSQFFDGVDLDKLADTSGRLPLIRRDGRRVYVMHADNFVGVDLATGEPTTLYTLIQDRTGRVVTMYPGTSAKS